jgi:hypothetical protein
MRTAGNVKEREKILLLVLPVVLTIHHLVALFHLISFHLVVVAA